MGHLLNKHHPLLLQMEYIMILEHNKKEYETYVLYCQWTGNEVQMEKLIHTIKTADPEDLYGDFATYEVSRTRIPEAVVDIHVSIKEFGSYIPMFQKCEGTFICPEFSENPYEKASELDSAFFHGKLRMFFSETSKKLLERLTSSHIRPIH
jgi:hypothetical protein